MFRGRKGGEGGGKKDPEATAREVVDSLNRGDYWTITDEVFEEPVSDELHESPGLERGEESLRKIRDFLRGRFGDDNPDDDGSGGGGGPPRPMPNRPHDPLGGGSVAPDSLVDTNQT